MRIFVAVNVPDKIKQNVKSTIEELKNCLAPIKWVEDKNMHVTLKFLGFIDDARLIDIVESVKDCVKGIKPFELSFKGVGVFPNKKAPKVIWIDIADGIKELKKLTDKVDTALANWREVEHEFSPHLTIGRIRDLVGLSSLNCILDKKAKLDFGSFELNEVTIMESMLKPSGPVYKKLASIKLK